MLRLIKKSLALALSISTVIFTFVPEAFFEKCKLLSNISKETNVILARVFSFIIMLLLSIIGYTLFFKFRRSVSIKGKNYNIQIKYGNLLKKSNCKKVINFDECFTTSIGDDPSKINPDSICGQYLKNNPIKNIQILIDNSQLEPAESKSKYQNKDRYDSGRLVPNRDYLLMAFAKLDKDGLGIMSYDEFLDCLATLWKEIDKYYGQKDVCIPILGSGVVRGELKDFTQQELLDIIILSYKLSSHKIKLPYKLHILCKKRDGFSLNKIGESGY